MPQHTAHQGIPILLEDDLPHIGAPLPTFELVNLALESVTQAAFSGQRLLLHFHPSVDTPTSMRSIEALHQMTTEIPELAVLHISADLPFTLQRFRAQTAYASGHFLSTMRGRDMLKHFGVLMVSSNMAGLPARALMVADTSYCLRHVEVVSALTALPDFARAVQVLHTL